MHLRRLLVLVALVGVSVLPGCTTTSTGDPAPAGGVSETVQTPSSSVEDEPGELPFAGAPKVENPLDTTDFQQDPCRALTAAQSRELNVGSSGTPDEGALGNGCKWENTETRGKTIIAFLDDDPRGLSAEYDANEKRKWAYFEELPPIEGHPAVARDLQDDRDKGYCSIVVGVSDEVAFSTFLQLSLANRGNKDPCDVAAQVAGMALRTMKQGG